MNTFTGNLTGKEIKTRNKNPQFLSLDDNRTYNYTEDENKKTKNDFIFASATAVFTSEEIGNWNTKTEEEEKNRLKILLGL